MLSVSLNIKLFFLFLFLGVIHINAQQKELTWEEIADQYTCPDWFRDAKFGIWFHWGPQAVPEQGGGWYARHMYMKDAGKQKFGKMARPYHEMTYGHPSEFGFKDVINLWKAENFDADLLVQFSKENGAKYITVLANHHDHFDLWNSTYHEWNAVNVGPKKDIIGEFAEATRKAGLKFGVTSHDDRFLNWWLPAFGADETGPKKGIPYDGRLTKEDGKGLWWEGLDPADLYGPVPEERTPEKIEAIKENWEKRHIELVDNYEPDLLYNDGFNFTYGEHGREVCRRMYNNSFKMNGRIESLMLLKRLEPGTVNEVESGGSNTLREYPWQSEITFTDWFYKKDRPLTHNARTILEMLIDAVSKNGNLLLSMELNPDGTIPPEIKEIVKTVGDWLKINGEAIYGTRPWKVFGDGKSVRGEEIKTVGTEIRNATANQKKGEHFNQRTTASPALAHDEVRFTTKGKDFYIIVMNPAKGQLAIPSLGKNGEVNPGILQHLIQLYDGRKISFKQNGESLIVNMPPVNGSSYPVVLKAIFKGIQY